MSQRIGTGQCMQRRGEPCIHSDECTPIRFVMPVFITIG